MRINFAVINRTCLAIALAAWVAGTPSAARAEAKPNSLFSDGAVLQQGIAVPVWGTANEGEKVTVKFQQQTVTAIAKDGRWLVRLKPLKAGGPFTLTVVGESNTLTITNVLVGEVWLCSGQSNMAFLLPRAASGAEAVAAAADPQLRLFTVPRSATDTPNTNAPASWEESSPETAAKFSPGSLDATCAKRGTCRWA